MARKLDGGSLAVTADDLTRLDGALTEAKLRLGELSPEHADALIPALSWHLFQRWPTQPNSNTQNTLKESSNELF